MTRRTLKGAAFLDSTITQQAAMMGYINDFWLMLFLTLAVIPLLLLIQRRAVPAQPADSDEVMDPNTRSRRAGCR